MNQKTSKASLFLMELIIAILFFSLAGGICIQLFVNSHLVSRNSINLNHAVMWTQNLSESFYACEDLESISSLYDNDYLDSDTATLYLFFDKNWNQISLEEMQSLANQYTTTYIASITCSTPADTSMTSAIIKVDILSSSLQDYFDSSENTTSIYTLTIKKYISAAQEVSEDE